MYRREIRTIAIALALPLLTLALCAQQPDSAAVVQHIDAIARARYDNILEYTDTEHYVVFRGKDQTRPAAEMTVKTTYRRGVGKNYQVVSQSGSEVIHKFGLLPLLDHEKRINDPAKVEKSWFISANYEMRVKPGVTRLIDGRECIALSLNPRRKAPNMLEGTLWVDAHDHSIVEVEGNASRNPSAFSGTTKMTRRYTLLNGYAMATHAHAESDSFLLGRTVVLIDYTDYKIQLRPKPN
jgi:hypothetical protein